MRGYYLFAPVEEDCVGPDSGIEKKVKAQCKAMSKINCELIQLSPVKYTGTLAEKIYRRLPFTPAWRKWEYKGEFDDADYVYIRQVYQDFSFVNYLKQIRKHNGKIRILYEVPTYPQNREARVSISGIPFYLKNLISNRFIGRYLDRIVTFYGQKEIFGVKCINTVNGIAFDNITLPRRTTKKDEIHILSVAQNAVWHGYDRALYGLARYYQTGGKPKIIYHIVGRPMPEYKKIIDTCGLGSNVILHGPKSGKELKELYKTADIGIDVLGGHRKDYPVSSSLKSREYSAYGLPIITSSPVDFLPSDCLYEFIAPYDDSELDFDGVVKWYNGLLENKSINDLSKEIRSYAESKCDMGASMQPIIDWIKTHSGNDQN